MTENLQQAIIDAISSNNKKELKNALKAGANPNFVNEGNQTPLKMAIDYGINWPLTEILLKGGADPNYGIGGMHPLVYSMTYYIDSGEEKNVSKLLKLLLKYKLDVNMPNETSSTMLHEAAHYDYPDVVKLLMKNKADAQAQDGEGEIPLMVALDSGSKEVAAILCDYIGDPNIKDNLGYSALKYAAEYNSKSVAEFLIKKGANIDSPEGYSNETPLMAATDKGHIEVVKLLLLNGADSKLENSNGDTALDIAVENENQELIDVLKNA